MVKLNFDVKTHILKNGLEVITIKKNTQISSINIGIKVGALNESLEEKGISHYIEHMIFKGTKNRTFQKLNDELEALGGEYNAFTDYSQTVYSISCLEEELKNAIELLSDMLINSEFPEEEIDKERGVILAEIRSSKDNIEDISFKRVNEAAFEKSALRFDVAGLDKNVKGFNRNELYQYYKKYYVPNNSLITMVSSLSHDEAIKEIEKHFDNWEAKKLINLNIKDGEFVAICEEALAEISEELGEELNETIHIGLIDHLAIAMKRLKNKEQINNPFIVEIETLYSVEFEMAKKIVNKLQDKYEIDFPEGEIGFITLHIHSARNGKMLSNSIKYSYLSNKIIIYIEEKFNSKIDKRSLDYARFLSHVRFTIERVLTDTVLKNDLTEIIKKSYPISYEIAEGASKIIEETLDKKVCDDEVAYIAMHVERFRVALQK